MRTTFATLATTLLLAGTSVLAQPAPTAPVRTESATSPFVYEALGATPRIELRKAPSTSAAAKASADAKASSAERTQDKTKSDAKTDARAAQAAVPTAETTH